MVKANWSGSYPCLCHGLWTLEVDGVDVSDKIPKGIRDIHMGTYGTYEEWHFDEITQRYLRTTTTDYAKTNGLLKTIIGSIRSLTIMTSNHRYSKQFRSKTSELVVAAGVFSRRTL